MTGTGGAAPNAPGSGWDADELVVARTLSGDRDSETFSFLKGASLPHSNEGEHAIPSWQRSAAPGADASVRLTQLQTGAVPGSLSRHNLWFIDLWLSECLLSFLFDCEMT